MESFENMEEVLQIIHARYITLSEAEIKRNNIILCQVLEYMVLKMKEENKLFKLMFNKIFFGGSFYDGLKVGSPNEYDIDLLLRFPSTAKAQVITSNRPGYVQVFLNNRTGYDTLCEYLRPYLDNQKVLRWMEGTVQSVLNGFPKSGSKYSVRHICNQDLYVHVTKGGPAFTMHVTGTIDRKSIIMDIDLVPCFEFAPSMWPKNGFKQNTSNYDGFFVVPKPPNSENYYKGRFWRLSFQTQERALIHQKEKLKPAIRLLKKMRSTKDHPIPSYYLKTVALWEVDQISTWESYSLSYTFMHVLKKYQEYISKKKIPYYWYQKHNLLGNIGNNTLINMDNFLKHVIRDIENNISKDPSAVAKYLLTYKEHQELFNEGVVQEPPVEEGWCTIL